MSLFWGRFLKAILFALWFTYLNTKSQSASFYFTVQENRGFYTNHHSRSVQTRDIMSCAQACGRDSNCTTANYDEVGKKCYLPDQRTRNILEESDLVLNRFYLIEKVTLDCPFGLLDQSCNHAKTMQWLDFTPYWCTLSGRRPIAKVNSLDECKELCKDGCAAVEWWENTATWCYECLTPEEKKLYTYTKDAGYPPYVFVKHYV